MERQRFGLFVESQPSTHIYSLHTLLYRGDGDRFVLCALRKRLQGGIQLVFQNYGNINYTSEGSKARCSGPTQALDSLES